MTTEDAQSELIHQQIRLAGANAEIAMLKSKLNAVSGRLIETINGISKFNTVKQTGYMALLNRIGGKWYFVAIVNPNEDDIIPEEFTLCIPIPEPESVQEFSGW